MTNLRLIVTVLLAFVAFPAPAELQHVEVGGELILLGEYYRNAYPSNDGVRWPATNLRARPVGVNVGAGNPLVSGFAFDEGNHLSFVSQYTRINVNAHFSEGVRLAVAFDNLAEWGEDFRSDYVTGLDGRAASHDDVEVYEAFVEADNLLGLPLRLRVGRQELRFGSEWLVGANDAGPAPAWGLSFDAVRLTYTRDKLTVDAFWAKLAERFSDFAEEDTDFQGIYASYAGPGESVLEAYWFWLRDDQSIEHVAGGPAIERLERLFSVDHYKTTNLYTIGLRFATEWNSFDLEAEAAWQLGDAGQVGALFTPGHYGHNHADFDAGALNLEAGYTFDRAWQPRAYLAYAFFEGEDRREGKPLGRLRAAINPFYTAEASVSFNRLFSNWSYSAIMDGTDLSNVHVFRTGLAATPTANIELTADLHYLMANQAFASPIEWSRGLLTRDGDRKLGWEGNLGATYQYTEDLYFALGWSRFLMGDGLEDGSFTSLNGLGFNGASGHADADYFWVESGISF